MARKVEMFEANDGSTFRDEESAIRRDAELEVAELARRLVDRSDASASDREELIDILQKPISAREIVDLARAHARLAWLRKITTAPVDETRTIDTFTLAELLAACEHRLWSHDWSESIFKKLRSELARAMKALEGQGA